MNQIPFLNLQSQYLEIKSEIDCAIQSVINDSSFIQGEKVRLFEQEFLEWNGSNYCVGCANGTDALEIALEALGIGLGDHVIVPAMTWISTAEAVVRVGAIPIFVDIDPVTYCIDIELAKKSITRKTKAIIAVHLYGYPADIIAIKDLCDSKGLFMIEDCAQAHGAMIDGTTKAGNVGHIGTFSFFPGKNLGAYGDAGCIVTKDADMANICREIGNHGQLNKHAHARIGRNSRLDGIQAAILCAKLPYLNEWIKRRRSVAKIYDDQLNPLVVAKPVCPKHGLHAYHLYVILCKNRDNLVAYMEHRGVSVGIHYPNVLPKLKVFGPYSQEQVTDEYPVATRISERAISLPISDQISHEEALITSQYINQFFEHA